MRDRGTYGVPLVGADGAARGPSLGAWLVGGLVVGGAVLWARHQAAQVEKLSAAAGVPYQSFAADLRARARELSSGITRRLSPREDT